jgi:hypothetical protein
MLRQIVTVAIAAMLLAAPVALARQTDEVEAPRADEVQAPRGDEVQAPRG